jgi:hypothetical protein
MFPNKVDEACQILARSALVPQQERLGMKGRGNCWDQAAIDLEQATGWQAVTALDLEIVRK